MIELDSLRLQGTLTTPTPPLLESQTQLHRSTVLQQTDLRVIPRARGISLRCGDWQASGGVAQAGWPAVRLPYVLIQCLTKALARKVLGH